MDKSVYIPKILEALEKIRPYLQDDQGDVEFVELTDDWVVKIRLLGSCKDCKYKGMTLKLGIERQLKLAVPEIKAVEEVP